MNQLILGDNLEILKKIDSESIDLIYLDPPFFSNRNYEVIWGDEGEIRSFKDRWSGGIDHYIAWLKERIEELYRLLKPTGSLYLHCDWHANAYIRVDILDKIFGIKNLRGEIIWCYNGPSNVSKNFPKKHDTIYSYSKSNTYIFNKESILIPYDETTLKRRKYAETKKKGIKFKGKEFTQYLQGKIPFDWWYDIHAGGQISKHERIGYPTQKPEKLLERIIKASSNEGDIILDPFVGGGTTLAVAEKLNRQWIGIDQSVQAIKVTELRLQKNANLYSKPFAVQLHKYDYDILRNKPAFEFETWIIEQFNAIPNVKQRNDYGIDGKTKTNTPIQVKRSDTIGRNVIDNFVSAVRRFDKKHYDQNIESEKPIGYIIAFSFGKGAIQEVARLKNKENIRIELLSVSDIVPIAQKPKLHLTFEDLGIDAKGLREVKFQAEAQSESGIEFFTWDLKYFENKGFNPQILFDKTGKQNCKFKAGAHQIAVKVIDKEGLENLEVLDLNINGAVKV